MNNENLKTFDFKVNAPDFNINASAFRVSSIEVLDYIKSLCSKLEEELKLSERDNIIYLSGPITGIEDYKQTFNLMKEYVKYIYHDRDVFIIDPTEYSDNLPEGIDFNYIDLLILGLELLKYADTMFVYDQDEEAWLNSRGCLAEAVYAKCNNIDIYNYTATLNIAMTRYSLDNDYKYSDFMLYLKEHDRASYDKFKEFINKKFGGNENEEA